jgi:hypothetical protein
MKEIFIETRDNEERPPTINVIGQLLDIMLGKVFTPNSFDLRSPMVDVYTNKILI